MTIRHVKTITSETIAAGTGVSRQVLIGSDEGPNFAMRRFIMEPGGGIPAHTNTVEHEQYVLGGRARIGIGDQQFDVETGSVVFIPAGMPHWYRVVGNEPFEFICVVPNLPDEIEMLS
ncbi:MAG: cupin domain-containing protein [Candidatus Krumholzibacteria bacterium]|nr:cupin domain-containing protein [Candidatus Krumholzibacteria bacterium]